MRFCSGLLISLVCLGSLASCASSRWTSEQKAEFINSCINGATSASAGQINSAQANSYCNCTFDVIESRYSYQELEQKGVSLIQELQNDGTIKACQQKTGLPVP